MNIFYGKVALRDYLKSITTSNSNIGFVPTMGALHQGHLALIQKSLSENEHTVVSIFVNPTQFNNPEDLAKYPRTLEEDIKKLTALDPKLFYTRQLLKIFMMENQYLNLSIFVYLRTKWKKNSNLVILMVWQPL